MFLFLALAQVSIAANPHLNRAHTPTLTLRTNAERMAAGLPPLRPRSLQARTGDHGGGGGRGGHDDDRGGGGRGGHDDDRGGGGRGDHDDDRGGGGRGDHDDDRGGKDHGGGGKDHGGGNPPKPQPSPKPDCDDKQKVRIKCKRKDGGHVGYVGKDYSNKGKQGFGLCKSSDKALEIDFENSVTPFDMKIPSRQDFHYLGWSGNNLGSDNSCILTNTKKTNIRDGPRNIGNAASSHSANSESQVWYYTRGNKRFESKWVNSGGNTLETKTCYNPDDDTFHLVSDVNSFLRRNRRAYEVEFELDE